MRRLKCVCGVVRVGPQDTVQMAGGHRVHRRRAEEPEREAVAQAAQGPLEGGLGVGEDQACAAWCEEGPGEAVREWGWVDAVLVSSFLILLQCVGKG